MTTILFLTIALTGCKKDDIKCSDDSEFCVFVSSEDFNQTGALIDKYLSGLDNSLSDDGKLERLKEWLKCKNCVANAEILCNSCIYTNPATSELKVWFMVNGQLTVKVLDIVMDDPLRFVTYHD